MNPLEPGYISAIRITPTEPPLYHTIENTLDALQQAVGGYIELVHINIGKTPVAVICDEEGRLKGYDFCCRLGGIDFYGPILILSEKIENGEAMFTSCEAGLHQVCNEYYAY